MKAIIAASIIAIGAPALADAPCSQVREAERILTDAQSDLETLARLLDFRASVVDETMRTHADLADHIARNNAAALDRLRQTCR